MIALLTMLASSAQAADDPGIWYRQQVGFGGWPTGVMSESKIQYRTPLARKEGSLMLNDTYAGAGAIARITPAFSEVGVMASFAPVDVFDLDVGFTRTQYYSKQYGLMGFTEGRGKLSTTRTERWENGDGAVGGGWSAFAVPTAKIAVGPVIAFYSPTISWISIEQGDVAEDYTYEPWRDLVVAWNDITIEHEAATLLAPVNKDDGTKFFFGGWFRDRSSLNGPDHSMTVGPVIIARPGSKPGIPTVLARSMFYLQDGDRVGGAPNLQLASIWVFE